MSDILHPKTYKMTRNYLLRGVLATALLLLSVGTFVYGQSTNVICTPTVEHSDVARIQLLKIEGKKYVTHGSKGYHDWRSAINIPITAGKSYPIRMQPKYLKAKSTVYWKIWIDYNMDGDFDDLYEYACFGKGVGSINGKLSIPSAIWNGETTMRVAISTDNYPNLPCDYIESGEVEDFTVTLSQGTQIIKKNIPRGGLCVHMPSKVGDTSVEKINNPKNEDHSKSSNLSVDTRSRISDETFELTVFPNPSVYYCILKLDLEGKNQKIDDIRITDIRGRLMTQMTYAHLNDNRYKLDTQSINGGVYTVTAYVGDRIFSSKLIVAK